MVKKLLVFAVALLILVPIASAQTNGTNLIGYGPKSTAMGGADVAWISDFNAMNINPAGISFSNGDMLGANIGLLFPSLHHTDFFGNDLDGESAIFPMPNAGYIKNLSGNRITFGLGLFSQGGMGAEFKGLNTAFMTQDDTKSQVLHAKLVPAVAVRVLPSLSLGASLDISYSAAQLTFFPDTSYYLAGFLGMETDDLTAWAVSFKAGLMWKPSDMFSFGIAYRSKVDFEYDGTVNVNFSSVPPLGIVGYDAVMSNFGWPQQLEFGLAFRPSERLMIAADAAWMNWENSVWEIVLDLTPPAGSAGLMNLQNKFMMHWEDQWIFAVGIDYMLSKKFSAQLGFNYGTNPIPSEFTNPLFPATVELHLSAGCVYSTNSGTEYQFAFVFVPNKEVVYTNATMPFGPDAVIEHSQFALNFGVNLKL